MKNYIWVKAQKEMVHCYPDAPEVVDYLRNVHRHIFYFKVYISVEHDDRDIEFIMFKHFVEEQLEVIKHKLITKSCEMMAKFLAKKIRKEYPDKEIMISVSEDNENGSFHTFPNDEEIIIN